MFRLLLLDIINCFFLLTYISFCSVFYCIVFLTIVFPVRRKTTSTIIESALPLWTGSSSFLEYLMDTIIALS